MTPRNTLRTLCGLGLFGAFALTLLADDKPAEKTPLPLVIVDATGNEQKATSWRFLTGTRRLSWLDPEKNEALLKDPANAKAYLMRGPEALVFRDENGTGWRDGVLTFIPLEHLRAYDYDAKARTAKVLVATSDKKDADLVLKGTEFPQFNKVSLDVKIDKGSLGTSQQTFTTETTATAKPNMQGLRITTPRLAAVPTGRVAEIVVADSSKKYPPEKVYDLQMLYHTRLGAKKAINGEKLSPLLLFRGPLRLDIAKVERLTAMGKLGTEWQVAAKDDKGGQDVSTLTLLADGELDGTALTVQGFLGRVQAGYKFFPIYTIHEILFDGAKPPKKP